MTNSTTNSTIAEGVTILGLGEYELAGIAFVTFVVLALLGCGCYKLKICQARARAGRRFV